MSQRTSVLRMWIDASDMLDRAERLQRRFFEPACAGRRTSWEPPVDLIETEGSLLVEVALPGVDPARLEVGFVSGGLLVAGEREPPATALGGRRAVVRRLEIPYGRFERRIALPAGRYELVRHELTHGCLSLVLRRLA
jgi:HSP20 family protein